MAGTSLRRVGVFALAAGAYTVLALAPWHAQEPVRRSVALVAATLILWISEIAPLGVVAMAVPMAATFTGLLQWRDALSAWGEPVIFLFLGAFLLARALDKHGAFDWIVRIRRSSGTERGRDLGVVLVVLALSGALSTMQNNTAVAAMMLPITTTLARRTRAPFAVLLALAWGCTFGGMATPVGTAPNFIGFEAMKRLDPTISFVSWLRMGLPIWFGTTLIGWGVLALATRLSRRRSPSEPRSDVPRWIDAFVVTDVGPQRELVDSDLPAAPASTARARSWAIGAFVFAAVLWLLPGMVISAASPDDPVAVFFRTYLPESLVPIGIAWTLFLLPVGPKGRPLLDRHDFQALDWDTLFLIAGGLCLGRVLETSGAAHELAAAVAGAEAPPIILMTALAGVTVLLSELTSNTATASLMVPIAGALADPLHMSPVQAIWLVALAASLGFALPISTPPNAIVYGTRMIPLRIMVVTGIAVDILATILLVVCISWLGV